MTDFIIEIRTVTTLLVLIVFSTCIYRFLPNHKGKIKYQFPGAVFTAFGWTLASFHFLGLHGYFQRIFQYVWKFDDDCIDYVVDVLLYV